MLGPSSSSNMAPKRIGPLARAWFKWKALRLPWRKRFLMGEYFSSLSSLPPTLASSNHTTFMRLTKIPPGFDLEGNTYWEFRLTRGTSSDERWRRIVNYPRSTHYSQVKVSPQWHQWLRHTRRDPPTLGEQEGDVARREQIKRLAAEADARWEAKPKVMEAPEDTAQRLVAPASPASKPNARRRPVAKFVVEEEVEKAEDPWAKSKAQGPGESWQPAAWDPTAPKKR